MDEGKISDGMDVEEEITNSSSFWSFGSLGMSTIVLACLLVIALKYETSQAFRYKLKFVLYVVVCSLVGLILLPIGLMRPWNPMNVQ